MINEKGMNKRAQEMSTNTIIFIVLGVIILVVLVLGFSLGWEKVFPFLSSQNIDKVQSVCNTACATNAQNDYCYQERVLKDPDTKTEARASCNILASIKLNAEGTNPELNLIRYNFNTCPSIRCDNAKPQCANIMIQLDGKKYVGKEYAPLSGACDTTGETKPVYATQPLANVATGLKDSTKPASSTNPYNLCCIKLA